MYDWPCDHSISASRFKDCHAQVVQVGVPSGGIEMFLMGSENGRVWSYMGEAMMRISVTAPVNLSKPVFMSQPNRRCRYVPFRQRMSAFDDRVRRFTDLVVTVRENA